MTDPIQWGRTPPAPLLEALDTIRALAGSFENIQVGDMLLPSAPSIARAYREAERLLTIALQEVYAP